MVNCWWSIGWGGHILQIIATCAVEIIAVIVPLLALTANQMAKIEEALQDCGSVSAVHLDELSSAAINGKAIPRMHEIGYHSESTMFIFTSPQKIANNHAMLGTLVMCHARQTLRLVTIYETHLYAQHGNTFRGERRLLSALFLSVIFKIGSWHPLFLVMTATMTIPLLTALSNLTHFDWTNKNHQLWVNAKTSSRGILR
mmetsp:Transcript_36102/g.66172  ORF Transcript_36102/g.66172 Transcript_36102/m.66172 type:complete len:200 (+) Transcript_36102:456-1055(+)